VSAQSSELVFHSGLSCTVHRAHLYSASTQHVLRIAFEEPIRKKASQTKEILRPDVSHSICRLLSRSSLASAARSWRARLQPGRD
jgi:hypothetical protein